MLGRKKGQEESEVAIAIIIFVFIIVTIFLFVQSNMVKVSVELKTMVEELEVIDATHLVKDCFTKGNETISADFLEENKGRKISELCSLNAGDIYVSVKDLEEDSEWVFGSGGKHSHSISVLILNDTKINMGELNVRL